MAALHGGARDSAIGGGDLIGWWIGVFRQADGGSEPASADAERGVRLAVWQAELWGLDWLTDLVRSGRAIDLGGDGYPSLLTAKSKDLLPPIRSGPPAARPVWIADADDIIDHSKWPGKTTIDEAAIDDCSPEEWLLVVVFDES